LLLLLCSAASLFVLFCLLSCYCVSVLVVANLTNKNKPVFQCVTVSSLICGSTAAHLLTAQRTLNDRSAAAAGNVSLCSAKRHQFERLLRIFSGLNTQLSDTIYKLVLNILLK